MRTVKLKLKESEAALIRLALTNLIHGSETPIKLTDDESKDLENIRDEITIQILSA